MSEKKHKVLFIDNDPVIREAIVVTLERKYQVITATSAKEAMKKLACDEIKDIFPDVILTDIKMSEEDGISFLKKVKVKWPTIPVMVVTAYADMSIAIEAVKSGAYDFIKKPFGWEEISLAIDQAIKYVELNRELLLAQTSSREAERLAELGLMAGSIAHEIINPITVLDGNLRILDIVINKKYADDAQMAEICKVSGKMVVRVLAIIKGLKNLARNTGNSTYRIASCLDIIQDTVSLCRDKFKAAGISFQFSRDIAHLKIECDQVEISQILINLLNNAEHAIEGMDKKWIRLEVLDLGDQIKFSVIDSGQGIPVDSRDKIFKTFYTTKEIGKGTGLGLSTCKRIAEEHGGTILIDTTSPNTQFDVVLLKRQSDRCVNKKAS